MQQESHKTIRQVLICSGQLDDIYCDPVLRQAYFVCGSSASHTRNDRPKGATADPTSRQTT
jgi:hypothetical protein